MLTGAARDDGIAGLGMHDTLGGLHGARIRRESHLNFLPALARMDTARILGDTRLMTRLSGRTEQRWRSHGGHHRSSHASSSGVQ
jgi:hypothetical protein